MIRSRRHSHWLSTSTGTQANKPVHLSFLDKNTKQIDEQHPPPPTPTPTRSVLSSFIYYRNASRYFRFLSQTKALTSPVYHHKCVLQISDLALAPGVTQVGGGWHTGNNGNDVDLFNQQSFMDLAFVHWGHQTCYGSVNFREQEIGPLTNINTHFFFPTLVQEIDQLAPKENVSSVSTQRLLIFNIFSDGLNFRDHNTRQRN